MALNNLSIVLILAVVATSSGVQYFDKFQALRNALRQTFASAGLKSQYSYQDNDRGVVHKCTGTPGPPFSVEWEPKVINPEGHITVYYDYTIPHYFKSGTLNVQLFFNNIPNPIFQDTFPVDCSQIGKYIKCPLQKDLRLKGSYPYSNLLLLKGYDGTYTAVLKLEDDKAELMICANATVKISSNDWN